MPPKARFLFACGGFFKQFSPRGAQTYFKLNKQKAMTTVKLTASQVQFLTKLLRAQLDSLENYNVVLHEPSSVSFYGRNNADELRLLAIEDNVRKQQLITSLLEILV